MATPSSTLQKLTDPKTDRKILKLLDLFKSNDPQTRRSAQVDVFHIYIAFEEMRSFIRRQISYAFYEFIYETEDNNGISEFLVVANAIFGDESLQEEYEKFITKILLPLHKTKGLNMYHFQLTQCIVKFLVNDASQTELVIKKLLTFWPKTDSHKELLFLQELQSILDVIEPAEFQKVMELLFRQISKSMSSTHSMVAKLALFLCENERVATLIAENSQTIFPIIIPLLYRNLLAHWDDKIRKSTTNALIRLMEMNQTLFYELKRSIPDELDNEEEIVVNNDYESNYYREVTS